MGVPDVWMSRRIHVEAKAEALLAKLGPVEEKKGTTEALKVNETRKRRGERRVEWVVLGLRRLRRRRGKDEDTTIAVRITK